MREKILWVSNKLQSSEPDQEECQVMSNLKVASFCRDQVVVVVVNHGSERLDRHVHDGVQDFRSVWSV